MSFIVFEGLDGSGKTTLIKKLQAHLEVQGTTVCITREPGGAPLSEEIRKLLLRKDGDTPTAKTELLLYEACRAQHVEKIIQPALDRGEWVLCDRFTASTIAFQSGGRELALNDIEWLNHFATSGLEPQVTVLLDLSVNESLNRMQGRESRTGQEQDRFESEPQAFHQAVRESYLNQAKKSQGWLLLDAGQSPEALFQNLLENLRERKCLES